MQKSVWDLTPFRIYNLNLVPRRFFERAKGLEWNIDRLYAMSENICSNPTNLIYVLIDEQNLIHGVIWAWINILDENLHVVLLSMDPEYQGPNGACIDAAYALLNKIRQDAGLRKIIFQTTRPRAFERHQARRSKTVLMEV